MAPAEDLNAALSARGLTVATAESLTGGQVCVALTAAAGASDTVNGGVVAYTTELKHLLLGVDAELLELRGPVHPEVAREMARGAARVCGASLGLSTTGVAGPETQNGVPVGTVFIAVYDSRDDSDHQVALTLSGPREEVCRATTTHVLQLAIRVVTRSV